MPTEADLKERARVMVTRMMDVGRVVYAIPFSVGRDVMEAAVRSAGLVLAETDKEADVTRWIPSAAPGDASDAKGDVLVLLEREDLGVFIFEVRGENAVEHARAILNEVPFVPQSRLLGQAIDVASPDASKALLVLAHSVVVWDDDWGDLFLLHLASPDPIARHNAVLSTFLAAMASDARKEARELLKEAHAREKFPKLRDTIEDAIKRLE
jgi:hypothetical protein